MSGLELRRGPCVCAAPVGTGCRRPSGHAGGFVELHAARDLAADAAGAYGPCPLGLCGLAHQPKQQEMFA